MQALAEHQQRIERSVAATSTFLTSHAASPAFSSDSASTCSFDELKAGLDTVKPELPCKLSQGGRISILLGGLHPMLASAA